MAFREIKAGKVKGHDRDKQFEIARSIYIGGAGLLSAARAARVSNRQVMIWRDAHGWKRPERAKECQFPKCGRPIEAYGLCAGHDAQKRKGRVLAPIRGPQGPCVGPRCTRKATTKGLCSSHADQRRRGKKLSVLGAKMPTAGSCIFRGCGKSRFAKGLCFGHYAQKRRGAPLTRLQKRGSAAS